jgi:hypothetical protein
MRTILNKRFAATCVAAAVSVLQGCATSASDEVRLYRSAQLRQGEYETVARLWVEAGRSAFWTPSHSSHEDGVAALRDKAAALGANGLINIACYRDPGLFSLGSESFVCYGKAIKVP